MDKKYQCPTYCGVNHNHSAYFKSETNGMVIDKNLLGNKVKSKKNRKKIKRWHIYAIVTILIGV